jgi:hypothetical protein
MRSVLLLIRVNSITDVMITAINIVICIVSALRFSSFSSSCHTQGR